ncbi:MAG: N-6 DNA methylase [Planctomycetota bacterium]
MDYGAPAGSIRDLRRDPTPDHIPYLDLMREGRAGAPRPDVAVEFQGSPVAYVVDATSRDADLAGLALLHRTLVYRADAPYMVVVEPGRLVVHALSLKDAVAPFEAGVHFKRDDPGSASAFQRLAMEPEGLPLASPEQEVHELLFSLLTKSIGRLTAAGVSAEDAVSLTGRALFTRFILDRGILQESEVGDACSGAERPEDLFRNKTATVSTCHWLDQTFNGDFLPVSATRALAEASSDVYPALSDIMHRSHDRQAVFEWAAVDFAHVPAGLLSQVYEHQAAQSDPAQRHATSVYYTPRRIAEYVVKEVFAAMEAEDPDSATRARVLDPAAGGGVFLVAAFRELVRAHWRMSKHRPSTKTLRQILYRQLAGYEISEAALRLTALSLYLTSLELDGNPRPLSKLQFKPLRGTVLRDVSGTPGSIGTIGIQVDPRHRFDVVVGNPPWTGAKAAVARAMSAAVRHVVQDRLGEEAAAGFSLPDGVPDLAFLWKAGVLARPGGWIAFALHARLLFKGTPGGLRARQQAFAAFEPTGVLNCADLRTTKVWPSTDAPFCLVFCRNRTAEPGSAFFLASPYQEPGINSQGRLRIDSSAAIPLPVDAVQNTPTLFKALARAGRIDLDLLRHVHSLGLPTLKQYWDSHGLAHTQGFQIGGKQHLDATPLRGLPMLKGAEHPLSMLLDGGGLPLFDHRLVRRLNRIPAYQGPLFVVRKTPPADRTKPLAIVSRSALAFSESYYGYSASSHADSLRLTGYMAALANSDLFLWYCLMTSAMFGVERDSLHKRDVDDFPVVPLERLTKRQGALVDRAVEGLGISVEAGRREANRLARAVYGFDPAEWRVIEDTLSIGLPHADARHRANRPPKPGAVRAFVKEFQQTIAGFLTGRELSVIQSTHSPEAPWRVLRLSLNGEGRLRSGESPTRLLLQAADDIGASQVVVSIEQPPMVLVGLLDSYRYWTRTRARQLALTIVHQHLDALIASTD